MREICLVCGSFIMGQRWKYCSDDCSNVQSSRNTRAKVRFEELKQFNIDARYKRVELNSSHAALKLIKELNNSV
jgi:predicted nucleic acid-binding Zn ribbon protein